MVTTRSSEQSRAKVETSTSARNATSVRAMGRLKRQRVKPRLCDVDSEVNDVPFARDCRSAGKRKAELSNGRAKKNVAHFAHVWPPTLVGKRNASFIDPYVHDSDAVAKLTLPGVIAPGHRNAVTMNSIICESVKCDQCPVYVFPPSAEGFIYAMYVHNLRNVTRFFPKLSAGWTLEYATVEDMAAIDPHRKLVDWIPIHTSKEINNCDVPKEEFQAKLRNLDAAVVEDREDDAELLKSKDFESKLTSILFQDGLKNSIHSFLWGKAFSESHMEKAFAFDGVRVANASFERLSRVANASFESLGVLMGGEREHATNAFTSRKVYQGSERELETLQATTDEIRRATATKRQLAQLKLDHLESARALVEKQDKEMMQHLVYWMAKSDTLMKEAMMSRVKLETSLQETEKKASVLQKFISSGATEIVEEMYTDALKEIKGQELIEKAKSSQKCCCICYHGLEGFSAATCEDGEKRHQRACFLPCMHANVCTTCSEKIWNEGPKECPLCRQPLTTRPRPVYL